MDGWRLPPVDILEKSPEVVFSQSDNSRRARLIEEALESYGVEAKVVQINTGPTVTQFGIEPGWDRRMREFKEKDRDGHVRVRQEEVSKTRVKVERINSLSSDLALALAAPTIRIEAPIPGQSLVGIEVPNTVSTSVTLRGVIETSVFQKMQAKTRLALALGKGAGGEAVTGDLTRMPHLLIAGATGSGKTVCLNTIICSLLLNNTPYDLRLVLIDPKRVELTSFNSIPHLASPVIVEAEKAVEALRWLAQEMDRRYQRLQVGSRQEYRRLQQDPPGRPEVAVSGAGHRRTGRSHDAGRGRGGANTVPSGPARSSRRHTPGSGHAASFGRCHHRTDQSQLPDAHQLCGNVAGGFPDHP